MGDGLRCVDCFVDALPNSNQQRGNHCHNKRGKDYGCCALIGFEIRCHGLVSNGF